MTPRTNAFDLAANMDDGNGVQPFLDALTNDELDALTVLVDRMGRAVHNEKSKTKRKATL